MKKNAYLIMLIACVLASPAFSAQKEAAPKKEFTKADYADHIKGTLNGMPEIMNLIPGLKKETDAKGNENYVYNGKALGDLDKEQVTKLYHRVSNEAVRIRTDRLNKQLESIRQADQASRQAQQAARPIIVPAIPVNPPTVYTPPQPPPAIPQQPKVPTPPPAPPKR